MEQNTAIGGGGFWDLVLGMIPGDTFGAWLNLPNSGLFWQKEPVPIWADLNRSQQTLNC